MISCVVLYTLLTSGILWRILSLRFKRALKKNQRAITPSPRVRINKQMRIKSLLPYRMTCFSERKKKLLLRRPKSLKIPEKIPIKGFVKKLTVKMRIPIVTARGRRITNPVIKYFFISLSFFKWIFFWKWGEAEEKIH